jgi:hypothetical protein
MCEAMRVASSALHEAKNARLLLLGFTLRRAKDVDKKQKCEHGEFN